MKKSPTLITKPKDWKTILMNCTVIDIICFFYSFSICLFYEQNAQWYSINYLWFLYSVIFEVKNRKKKFIPEYFQVLNKLNQKNYLKTTLISKWLSKYPTVAKTGLSASRKEGFHHLPWSIKSLTNAIYSDPPQWSLLITNASSKTKTQTLS